MAGWVCNCAYRTHIHTRIVVRDSFCWTCRNKNNNIEKYKTSNDRPRQFLPSSKSRQASVIALKCHCRCSIMPRSAMITLCNTQRATAPSSQKTLVRFIFFFSFRRVVYGLTASTVCFFCVRVYLAAAAILFIVYICISPAEDTTNLLYVGYYIHRARYTHKQRI